MTKVLSAVAPIAGAGIGFLTGGPAGAALGLGLGGAAGGAFTAMNPPNMAGMAGGAAFDPALYRMSPEDLSSYLALLYPAAPVADPATPAVTNPATPAVTNQVAPVAGPSGFAIGEQIAQGGSIREQAIRAMYANTGQPQPDAAGLAWWMGPEQGTLGQIESNIQAASLANGTSRGNLYSDKMYEGDTLTESGRNAYSWMGYGTPNRAAFDPVTSNPAAAEREMWGNPAPERETSAPAEETQTTTQRGMGGGPSITNPGINGRTPAFNIAGGTLSKTNTIVQQEFERRFPEQLAALDALRAQVAPNVSLARQAALGQIRDQASQAQGNLRQQMARRGVLGSSFGESAASQMSAEFSKQAAQVEVQAAQQEMDLTVRFIDMQRGIMAEALARDITELGIGSDLAIASGRMATDIANIQAQLASAELQARTQLRVADINSSASRAAADIQARASRYASDAGVRAADIQSLASRYATDAGERAQIMTVLGSMSNAQLAAAASGYAADIGLLSTGVTAGASTANAELDARSRIIQAGLGANSAALGYQTEARTAANQLSSQEAAGRANLFGNLAGLGLGAFFNGSGLGRAANTNFDPNFNISNFGQPNFGFGAHRIGGG